MERHAGRLYTAALTPIQIQAPIAGSDVVPFGKPQPSCSAVNPCGATFQLDVNSDRSFIDRGSPSWCGIAVFSPVFLVAERRPVSQPFENRSERRWIGNLKFEFLSAFVLGLPRLPFIGEYRFRACLSNPE